MGTEQQVIVELYNALQGLERKLFSLADEHGDRSCDYDVCLEVRVARRAMKRAEEIKIPLVSLKPEGDSHV
jgi:hypothetical protein